MNKKGFTLVEVLAVIVILGLLITMVTPKIMSNYRNKKDTLYENMVKEIERISSMYLTNNPELYQEISSDGFTNISINSLCIDNLISCPVVDPRNDSEINGYVKVSYEDNKYEYEFINEEYINENIVLNIVLNGGSISDNPEGTYKEGDLVKIAIPTKENYKFVRWEVVKGNSTLKGDKLTIGSTNTILYAVWEKYSNLVIDLDGGTVSENQSGIYKSGTNLKLIEPTKENYKFVGWKIREGNGVLSGNGLLIGSSDIVIKATWKKMIFVDIPLQNGTLIYNGSSQSPTWSNYDESYMEISGDSSGINAGKYLATFTLNDDYVWRDGTNSPKIIEWSIEKAEGLLSLSESSGTINGIGISTTTFTVDRSGDGLISVSSSDTSVATVSLSGNVVTVNSAKSGTATITVFVAEGTNYKPTGSVTYSLTTQISYNITINSVLGGILTSSASTVVSGDIVTLTVTPTTDYSYYGATINYTEGGVDKTIELGSDELTFTMPAGDVIITASFKADTITVISTGSHLWHDLYSTTSGEVNGSQTVYFDIKYNATKNTTTVIFPENAGLTYWRGYGGWGIFTTTVTIKATDSGQSASTTLKRSMSYAGDSGSWNSDWLSASPTSITVKHSNTAGGKSIAITSSSFYDSIYDGTGSSSGTWSSGTYTG